MTFTAFGFSVGIFLFSVLTVYFPGELQEGHPTRFARPQSGFSLNELIFNSHIDEATRRRWLPFSNTLVLTGFNVYEGLRIDDPDKLKGRDFIFRARGRNLRAILDLANLSKVDFYGAELQGASMIGAEFQSTSLDQANLKHAKLDGAKFRNTSFKGTNLQSARLGYADLRNASFEGTNLQNVWLFLAQMQNTSYKEVQFQV
jgi:Pentapeptide repeats (9 copies)